MPQAIDQQGDQSEEQWLVELLSGNPLQRAEAPVSDSELQDMGLQVAASGVIELPRSFQAIDTQSIRRALGDYGIEREVRVEPVLASTNSSLIDAIQAGEMSTDILIADYQYGGRGRRGRAWISPPGFGVAMSIVCPLNRPIAECSALSLVAGTVVADALIELGAKDTQLKWPNDVLREDGKVSGILAEVATTSPACIVLGIGINVGTVATAVDRQVDQPIATLTDCGRNRTEVVVAVLSRLFPALAEFDSSGFAPFRERWERHHAFAHQPVRVEQGGQIVEGIARGVDLDGRFEVATRQGLQRFVAGEVSVRQAKGGRG